MIHLWDDESQDNSQWRTIEKTFSAPSPGGQSLGDHGVGNFVLELQCKP
jgi:hypothetical protein